MAKETLIGFDSAWANKAPGAICAITLDHGTLLDFKPPKLVRFDQAAAYIEEAALASEYVLVALDQPTLVPNKTSMRPVERVAGSIVNAIGGGVQPANRGKTTMFGDRAPIWWFLDRIGARENPTVAREASTGLFLIEVFPALALPSIIPSIWYRRRAAKYNPVGPRFSLEDWCLVAKEIARFAEELGASPVAFAANELSRLESPKKGDQDKLDALICLTIAWMWRCQPRESSVLIGDNTSGYMVTPIKDDTRAVLAKAALRKSVQMDEAWIGDARRSFRQVDSGEPESAVVEHAPRKEMDLVPSINDVTATNKTCPECGHAFKGKGWGGIDAHWRRFHEGVMPYSQAWSIIRSGGKPSKRT